ncbi:MAG: acylphosphatase [Gemmatimonadota bacterium]|jgi:acylphosphatase
MQPSVAEVRVGVILEGRVQGVGFRWWTRRQASGLGLRGTVRNLSDGTVEVHLAGPADIVADFLLTLRRGPQGSRVTRVSSVEPAVDLPPDFRVIR